VEAGYSTFDESVLIAGIILKTPLTLQTGKFSGKLLFRTKKIAQDKLENRLC